MIKFIVGVLVFVLGWCIWDKVVDRVDEFLKEKMSKKAYNILTWSVFTVMFGLIIYAIVR